MLLASVHQWLIGSTTQPSRRQTLFWFGLSLVCAALYSLPGVQLAFSSDYIVQDDARQHVFWMERLVDPTAFPNDPIADYFQSVAPPGYIALYKGIAALGIHPLVFNKVLPLILAVIIAGYSFGLCLQMLPVPLAAFMATALLNQNLWMKDDLSSGTPRAFLYPLLLAFSYYLLRRDAKPLLWKSLLPCAVVLILQGVFYPQTVFLSAGVLVLQLVSWDQGKPRLSSRPQDYWFCAAGLALSALVLAPYALIESPFGPEITVAEAKTMPEFFEEGRAHFFDDEPWKYWLLGGRSGLLPAYFLTPITLCAGFLLPILLRFPTIFPLASQITQKSGFLIRLTLVSVGLFFAAHAVLFTLYHPSRYTHHSFRIILALAAAIALTLVLDGLLRWASQTPRSQLWRPIVGFAGVALIGVGVVFYPAFLDTFPRAGYKAGQVPVLYDFFKLQPQESLIASLSREADYLPTFTQRSVLVSYEYGLPYHTGYYRPFRQRVVDLMQAQYSPDPATLQAVIQQYGIDFWLLDDAFLAPDYIAEDWLHQFQPEAQVVQEQLAQGVMPAIANLIGPCSVFRAEGYVVLDAQCMAATENPPS